jgi:TRAP-type C4-dicarboxylate transport system permease large subunit
VSPRRARVWAAMSESFWILLLSLVVMFVFFVALGAFSPGEAVGITIVVAVMAVLWVAHAIWVSRHSAGRDARATSDRERRGF